jgi:dihydropteroate synthase
MMTLNCKGKILYVEMPLVMGIINVSPDSFYSASAISLTEDMLQKVEAMIQDGADILDIGGQSTRPGSEKISEEDELKRVIPVIETIARHFPHLPLSIDSFYSKVAKLAVQAGCSIVNDISAGEFDEPMLETVSGLKVPYICMHMKGTPQNMQQHTSYENLIPEVLDHLIRKSEQCRMAGIHDVIIDPGFGFAKTIEHNFSLLKNLGIFKITGRPILAGISRKSTIYKTLGVTPEAALNGTTVLNTLALDQGADILRVHDVKEAKEAVVLMQAYKKAAS